MMWLGIQPADLAQMLQVAKEDNASQGITGHHQALLHDLMTNTYFTLPDTDAICQTRGTRPGDPVADVLFNLCMSLVLRDFHTEMAASTVVPWLGSAEPVKDFHATAPLPHEGYVDVTFVDDCAVLMHAKSNDTLLSVVHAVVQSFTSAAGKRGVEVNFDRGKTELLWNIVEKGARAMKEQVHAADNVTTSFFGSTLTNALRFTCVTSTSI